MTLHKLVKMTEETIHKISKGAFWVSVTAVSVMMLIMVAEVIGRYFLRRPIKGSPELVEIVMLLVVFFGIGYATQKKSHVNVDLIVSLFKRRTRAILDSFLSFINMGVIVLMVWQFGARAWELFKNPGPSTTTWEIPLLPLIMIVEVGCFLLCLELIIEFFHNLSQTHRD